jgi:hypothetical protein
MPRFRSRVSVDRWLYQRSRERDFSDILNVTVKYGYFIVVTLGVFEALRDLASASCRNCSGPSHTAVPATAFGSIWGQQDPKPMERQLYRRLQP